MKLPKAVLYMSLALNIALLIIAVQPKTEYNVALGQTTAQGGKYAAASYKVGGSRDALWVAERDSARLLLFQYETSSSSELVMPLQASRDLRADLEQQRVGNLIMLTPSISSSRSLLCVIDTDSGRMVLYEYNTSNNIIELLQQTDLSAALGQVPARPVTEK